MMTECPLKKDLELYKKYKKEWFVMKDGWLELRDDAPQYVKDFFAKFWDKY